MTINNVRETAAKWVFQELRGYDPNSMRLPPEKDYEICGKALLIVAKGDETLAEAERNWVIGGMAAQGAPESVLEMLKTYEATEDLAEVISRSMPVKTLRRALLYEAISACSADGAYKEGEKAAVRKLAAKLEVPEDVVKQIEDLYQEDMSAVPARLIILPVWSGLKTFANSYVGTFLVLMES